MFFILIKEETGNMTSDICSQIKVTDKVKTYGAVVFNPMNITQSPQTTFVDGSDFVDSAESLLTDKFNASGCIYYGWAQ